MKALRMRSSFLLSVLGATWVTHAPTAALAHGPPPFIEVDNVAKDPTEVPPPLSRSNPKVVTVDLIAEEVIAEIAPGQKAWVWTFNRTIPGPMIRVMEGDTLVVNLTNALHGNLEPHNIDFHAAMGPGGGSAVTNVEPGETKTLRFKALRQGAFIYHCAAEGKPWEHVAYGMYGLIMVEPKGGLPRVDEEFYVGQSDWYLKPAGAGNAEGLPADVLILDEDRALAEQPTMYSFNGHKQALLAPALFGDKIKAEQGDTVRFFFVNGGPNKGSNWHIIGTIFDRVYKGHVKDATRNEETVYVAPGSAAVFELITPVPGEYTIVDHALWRVPQGAGGLLHVEQTAAWPLDIYAPEP